MSFWVANPSTTCGFYLYLHFYYAYGFCESGHTGLFFICFLTFQVSSPAAWGSLLKCFLYSHFLAPRQGAMGGWAHRGMLTGERLHETFLVCCLKVVWSLPRWMGPFRARAPRESGGSYSVAHPPDSIGC